MPYAIVMFDPDKVDQRDVDELKAALDKVVAWSLSDLSTIDPTAPMRPTAKDIRVEPKEIFVGQWEMHRSDKNRSPVEVFVLAGRSGGRSEEKVREIIGRRITALKIIKPEYLGEDNSCVWLHFSERNSFGWIPLPG